MRQKGLARDSKESRNEGRTKISRLVGVGGPRYTKPHPPLCLGAENAAQIFRRGGEKNARAKVAQNARAKCSRNPWRKFAPRIFQGIIFWSRSGNPPTLGLTSRAMARDFGAAARSGSFPLSLLRSRRPDGSLVLPGPRWWGGGGKRGTARANGC